MVFISRTGRWRQWVLACYVSVIFFNSLMPAPVSSAESGWLMGRIQDWFLSLGLDPAWITEYIIRKLAHFLEYGVMGVLLVWATIQYEKRGAFWLRWYGPVLLLAPLVDETIQLFVPGRSGQLSDVWLDVSGATAGAAAAWLLAGIRMRKAGGHLAGQRRKSDGRRRDEDEL